MEGQTLGQKRIEAPLITAVYGLRTEAPMPAAAVVAAAAAALLLLLLPAVV